MFGSAQKSSERRERKRMRMRRHGVKGMLQAQSRQRRRAAGVLLFLTGLFAALIPTVASAKVFFYALTDDGDLVKYDPDTDQLQITPGVGQGYVRGEDSPGREQTRILDVARQRIVTGAGRVNGIAVLNLQAKTATEVPLGPPGTVVRILQFIYPRRASRFYVHWVRQSSPTATPEVVMTAVGLDGQNLGTSPSPLVEGAWPVYHPDGRNFYTFEGGRRVTLIDGETLGVVATYDLAPLVQAGVTGPGLSDVRDGRALLPGRTGPPSDPVRPWTLFTTDLTFSPQSASPRIATGLASAGSRLVPGGRTILLQEPLRPRSSSGAGRLHFYDVTSGTKLGMVEFSAPEGADILGFHPDGRRLFIRTYGDNPDGGLQTRLVIVDAVTRTVVRDRPFAKIGVASDFVDE